MVETDNETHWLSQTWTDWSGSAALAKLHRRCPSCQRTYEEEIDHCEQDGALLVPPDEEAVTGQMFADRYEVMAIAGRGGMSNVYKARDTVTDAVVAIKVLRAPLSDSAAVKRFQHEAKTISRLSHVNIVKVHNFGTFHGHAFMVMDCLSGRSLSERLRQDGKLTTQEFFKLAPRICSGLHHAHQRQVVHRDLKPANMILVPDSTGQETIQLVDFGISKVPGLDVDDEQQGKQSFIGSPVYMSPEQWRSSKSVDHRADIYSLGCVFFECITGYPPIIGKSVLEFMRGHTIEPPLPFPPELEMDESVCKTIARCLGKEPSQRPSLALIMGVITSAAQHSSN